MTSRIRANPQTEGLYPAICRRMKEIALELGVRAAGIERGYAVPYKKGRGTSLGSSVSS